MIQIPAFLESLTRALVARNKNLRTNRSKYTPHQGVKEMARRVRKGLCDDQTDE